MNDDSTAQIICTGTAWVEGFASAEKVQELPAPGTELQFSRRGLDNSFLTNLQVILQGTTYTDVAVAFRAGRPIDLGVRRLGGTLPGPDHVAHVFECSAEFCQRLGNLTVERVREIAQNWYALRGHQNTSSKPDRVEYRTEIIQNLVAMAQVAQARGTRLLLRVEYQPLP